MAITFMAYGPLGRRVGVRQERYHDALHNFGGRRTRFSSPSGRWLLRRHRKTFAQRRYRNSHANVAPVRWRQILEGQVQIWWSGVRLHVCFPRLFSTTVFTIMSRTIILSGWVSDVRPPPLFFNDRITFERFELEGCNFVWGLIMEIFPRQVSSKSAPFHISFLQIRSFQRAFAAFTNGLMHSRWDHGAALERIRSS